jgi:hypothetical protein
MTIFTGSSTRLLSFLPVTVLVMFGFGASSALAANPNWRVITQPVPKNMPPGGTGQFVISVEDIGDAPSDGAPVTVVDHLPAGMTATSAGTLQSGGEGELQIPGMWGEAGCEGVGTETVTCTYDEAIAGGPIPPYEFDGRGRSAGGQPLEIGINVAVPAGPEGQALRNQTTISGGGASLSASDTVTAAISSTPAPFAVENVHEWFTNADGTPDTRAGSHPYELASSVMFNVGRTRFGRVTERNASGEVKDVHLDFPAGLVGSVGRLPRCPRYDFDVHIIRDLEGTNCPPDTQVGIALLFTESYTEYQIPIYNLVPPPGMPAQLGLTEGNSKLALFDVGVATGAGYNVTVDLQNIVEAGVTGSLISIWGDPADHSHDAMRYPVPTTHSAGELGTSIPFEGPSGPLLSLPGRCGPMGAQELRADSWENPLELADVAPVSFFASDESEQPVSLEGCAGLAFTPTLTVKPESSTPDSPTGLDLNMSFPHPETEAGTTESDLKEASVTLPAGFVVNPAAANGIGAGFGACSLQQVGLEQAGPSSCPDSSKLGTVQITSPALEPGAVLTGSVYLAQQGNLPGNGSNPFGSLLALYIVAEGDGVRVKVPGKVTLDQATGQVTADFGQDPVTSASTGTEQFIPQLPIGDVHVSFWGGPAAALVTPAACGTYTGGAHLTPWDGNEPTQIALPFTVNQGCGVGGFTPAFTAGTTTNQAASFSPLTMTFSRQDGEQDFNSLEETLPPGVSAKLAGVPECGNTEASAGACPESSRIGSVTVGAGAGPNPYYVHGSVYLTGPYNGGPFGDVVEVPAVAGPFNLDENGKPVTVRGSIRINPTTAQATVVSDPFPSILQGIPLQERNVEVNLNRPGFTFNASNCDPLSLTATLTSTQGASAPVSSPYQATNCATLPFAPKLTASVSGQGSKANGTSFNVKLESAGLGQANVHKVDLQLPIALPARLTTLQKACVAATFESNPASCPEGSVIGKATIHTPLLNNSLSGPAYLVSHGGAAFPDVEFVLQGEGVTLILDGNTQITKGITYSKFETAPDAPFTTFETELPAGPKSILGTNVPESEKYSLCKANLAMPTEITGQNGAVIKQSTKIAATGCAKVRALTRAQKLAKALKACRRDGKKARRAKCEKAARKRFGAVRRKKK